MEAGKLCRRILFQRRDMSLDSYGQQVTSWSEAFTTWASIEALSARELFAAQAVQSEVTHKITVRYRAELANPAVVAAMRVVYRGRVFNIQGATNVEERNRTVEIFVSEGLNNG